MRKARFIFRCGYCLTFHPQRIWMLLACGHTDVLEALPLLCSICLHLHHCVSRCAVPSPRALPAPSAFLSNLQALPLPSIRPRLPGCAAGHGLLWGLSKTTFCFFVKMTSEGDKQSYYCPDLEHEKIEVQTAFCPVSERCACQDQNSSRGFMHLNTGLFI